MADDVEYMRTAVHVEHWTPVFESPRFAFPGAEGVSPDTFASLKAGWGAHSFGIIAGAQWMQSTRKLIADGAISINPLELLAAVAAVVLIGQTGIIPATRRPEMRQHDGLRSSQLCGIIERRHEASAEHFHKMPHAIHSNMLATAYWKRRKSRGRPHKSRILDRSGSSDRRMCLSNGSNKSIRAHKQLGI